MIGKHIIVDMFDIHSDKFININKNDTTIEKWNSFIKECFDQANISLLNISWHNFDNNGAFTAIYLLSESHLSIHTWPEYNYIALDVFTCGNSNTQLIVDKVIKYFEPKYTNLHNFERGQKNK
jgi:S-adenosylmethionine decarboxylase